jgi:hypothetical protein
VKPLLNLTTPTAAQSVYAKLHLESTDFPVSPFEVLASPIGSGVGTAISPLSERGPIYRVNANVKGGSKLKVYGEALVANTVAPRMGAAIFYSTNPVSGKRMVGKVSAATSTGTSVAEVALASLSFSGVKRLKRILAVLGLTTLGASDEVDGYLRIASADLDPMELNCPFEPIKGALVNAAAQCDLMMSDYDVDVGTKDNPTISGFANLSAAPAAAGYAAYALLLET